MSSSPAAASGHTPLRIVFAAVGSRGDVQPLVAVALHARSRGHTVKVVAPPNCESWVRSFGLDFEPCGVDFQKMLADQPAMLTGNTLRIARLMRAQMESDAPGQLNDLVRACTGSDVLVWAGVAITAPTAAEAAHVASVNVMYSSCWVPSSEHPPPFFHWYGLPRWVNRLLWRVNAWGGRREFDRMLRPMRTALGLPKRNLFEQFFVEGCHVIAADDVLFPSDPEWDAERYPRTGFVFLHDDRPLDAELDAWLRDGPAPIFVGFGSMSGAGPRRALPALIDALAGSGYRCLVGAGWSQVDAGALPAGWRVVGDVPHAKLFSRVALVVHHGGSGTTASVLRAGVPQLILPLLLDQYHHAHLLHLAGLAPKSVGMEQVTAPVLRRLIDAALAVPSELLRQTAERVKASDASGALSTSLRSGRGACAMTSVGAIVKVRLAHRFHGARELLGRRGKKLP